MTQALVTRQQVFDAEPNFNGDEPNWTVEVDGDPAIRCQLTLAPGEGSAADPATALNAARAVNFIAPLVAAEPGFVSVLDLPAPRGHLISS